MKSDWLGYCLGFIGVTIFGITLPMTKLAIHDFSPWFLTSGRAVLAGFAALTLLLILRRPFPRPHLKTLCLIAIGSVLGFPIFLGFAMLTVPSSHGAVVLAVLPLLTAMCGAVVAREKPSFAFWFWAILGAGVVCAYVMKDGNLSFAQGDIFLILAAIAAASSYAFSGTLARILPGWEVACWVVVIALPFTLTASYFFWEPAYLDASPRSWMAFGYVGLFSMFIGFFAWNAGLALGGIAKVGQVQLFQTFITLAASALLLGEVIDGTTILFALATLIIVYLGKRSSVVRSAPESDVSGTAPQDTRT